MYLVPLHHCKKTAAIHNLFLFVKQQQTKNEMDKRSGYIEICEVYKVIKKAFMINCDLKIKPEPYFNITEK